MSLGGERDLVPLGQGFTTVKRGYSRIEVDRHLEELESDIKLLTSDRDHAISQAGDLARQLEVARSEIDELRGQVERLSLPPTTLEGLSERLQRMLRLAQDEASETKARAEAEAVHIRAKAEADASAMRTRYDQLLADLDARRQEMEAEHRSLMDSARAEADSIVNKAKQERLRLDLEAEERRTKIEEDFEIAMAARRTESMRVLAEQEAASKAEAERRVREASDEAERIRAAIAKELAEHKADVERRHRESVEDANRRRQESISEANARVAEATDEAERRVREATELATSRINHAADRVESLRELRTTIANQISSARSILTEADVLLGDAGLAALRYRQPEPAQGGSAEADAPTLTDQPAVTNGAGHEAPARETSDVAR